jgi:hypothetical protein
VQGRHLGTAYGLRTAEHRPRNPLLEVENARGDRHCRLAEEAATDFLAHSAAWQALGMATARGLGLARLQALPLVKALLARQMMFGRR